MATLNNHLALFDLIGVLARKRYLMAERWLSRLGLNHTEGRLLTLLDQAEGEATQEALSSQLHIDRSNAGRALKALKHRGDIVRSKDDADKRTYRVRITDQGRHTVAEISKLREQMAATFFGPLKDDEAAAIVRLLSAGLKDEDP